MNYDTTVSLIPEMELSYSQKDWWNAQRTHIKLKAQMQPFKINWEFTETVEFSVNGEREISEMVRLLNDELWPKSVITEIPKKTNIELKEEIVSRLQNNTAIRKAVDMREKDNITVQRNAILEYEAIMRYILEELEK